MKHTTRRQVLVIRGKRESYPFNATCLLRCIVLRSPEGTDGGKIVVCSSSLGGFLAACVMVASQCKMKSLERIALLSAPRRLTPNRDV